MIKVHHLTGRDHVPKPRVAGSIPAGGTQSRYITWRPGASGELPMGDVGLPALVGHLGFEPHEGGAWSLLRLGRHEPPPGEGPPDRGDRRDRGGGLSCRIYMTDRGFEGSPSLGQLREILTANS